MAEVDELLARISDNQLRAELEAAVSDLRDRREFGLVFEQHIPEKAYLRGLRVKAGATVSRRDGSWSADRVVVSMRAKKALTRDTSSGAEEWVGTSELLMTKRFGEPIYPALVPDGEVRCGGEKPVHAVIDGENYHALQLLRYLHAGRVDCVYLDPPYNTGAKDWKYNNQFVDKKDRYRHSQWLSFMEKRLELAKELLAPDGVLIITIDEHEVFHLGVLLEQVFPEYLRHTVTIVNNPKGTGKLNFARVDEYAIFCVPDRGKRSVISGVPVADVADVAEEEEPEEPEEPEELDEQPDEADVPPPRLPRSTRHPVNNRSREPHGLPCASRGCSSGGRRSAGLRAPR